MLDELVKRKRERKSDLEKKIERERESTVRLRKRKEVSEDTSAMYASDANVTLAICLIQHRHDSDPTPFCFLNRFL